MLLEAVTGRDLVSHSLLETIQAKGGISAGERIEAYRANVRAAHLNALDQAFPVTRSVLGERYWRHLLEKEIEVFDSNSPDLHTYGEFVPGLLQTLQQRQPALEDFPYLRDLATLEWYIHCARFVADDPQFDWKAFAALAPNLQTRAILKPSLALKIFHSAYPVDTIWHEHQASESAASDSGSPTACCIHRVNRFDVTVTRLTPENADLLLAISNGISLEELSGQDKLKQPEMIIRQLHNWIQRGWVVAFEVR